MFYLMVRIWICISFSKSPFLDFHIDSLSRRCSSKKFIFRIVNRIFINGGLPETYRAIYQTIRSALCLSHLQTKENDCNDCRDYPNSPPHTSVLKQCDLTEWLKAIHYSISIPSMGLFKSNSWSAMYKYASVMNPSPSK